MTQMNGWMILTKTDIRYNWMISRYQEVENKIKHIA